MWTRARLLEKGFDVKFTSDLATVCTLMCTISMPDTLRVAYGYGSDEVTALDLAVKSAQKQGFLTGDTE